ncbi:deoxynucleoside kinase-like [Adelges cooleyi]|uniref:deoxynucleoside kinase-like n=1 Tax=Adelges cooleyi TaxID=133065 RepID=UPI00218080DD|nr:deoxynucleoside kinase-like [Adelges cooleyi]
MMRWSQCFCCSASAALRCVLNLHCVELRQLFSLPYTFAVATHKTMSSNKSDKIYTVLIEGNVGSGKTTFLERFADCPNVLLAKEPVHKWQNVDGYNFLGLMYDDPKRWSFAFQSIVQRTMLEMHQLRPNSNQNIKIMERSIYSARNIFVENLFKDNYLSAPEYAVLDAWYKWLTENVEIECDLIIYLRTEPEVAYKRIKTRGRSEEKAIPFEHIKHLHELHEKWLNVERTKVPNATPVVVVDANQNMEYVEKESKYIRDLITANASASAVVESQVKDKSNNDNDQILKDIHKISPKCKLISDAAIIPVQRV